MHLFPGLKTFDHIQYEYGNDSKPLHISKYQSLTIWCHHHCIVSMKWPFSVFNCLCAARRLFLPPPQKLPFTPHLLWIELRFLSLSPSVTLFLSDEVQLQKGKVSYWKLSLQVCACICVLGATKVCARHAYVHVHICLWKGWENICLCIDVCMWVWIRFVSDCSSEFMVGGCTCFPPGILLIIQLPYSSAALLSFHEH